MNLSMKFTVKKGNILPIDETIIVNYEEKNQATRIRLILNLIINLTIVVMELIAINISFKKQGLTLFQYYTEDSNILALVACLLCSIYLIRNIITGNYEIPKWVAILKYMAVCCLTVTFIVVILVLAPMQGSGGYQVLLFSGSLLYQHFLCPVLALAGFLLLDMAPLNKQDIRFAIVPTIVYAIVSILLNIIKVLDGPYPFLQVYEQPVWMSILWFIVILGGAHLSSWLILFFSHKRNVK